MDRKLAYADEANKAVGDLASWMSTSYRENDPKLDRAVSIIRLAAREAPMKIADLLAERLGGWAARLGDTDKQVREDAYRDLAAEIAESAAADPDNEHLDVFSRLISACAQALVDMREAGYDAGCDYVEACVSRALLAINSYSACA
jgi:hypothetical protein